MDTLEPSETQNVEKNPKPNSVSQLTTHDKEQDRRIWIYSFVTFMIPSFLLLLIMVSLGDSSHPFIMTLLIAVIISCIPASVAHLSHNQQISRLLKLSAKEDSLIVVEVNDVKVGQLTPEEYIDIKNDVMFDSKNYLRQSIEVGFASLRFIKQLLYLIPMAFLLTVIFVLATTDPIVLQQTTMESIVPIQNFIRGLAFLCILVTIMLDVSFPSRYLGLNSAFDEDLTKRIRRKIQVPSIGKVTIIEKYGAETLVIQNIDFIENRL